MKKCAAVVFTAGVIAAGLTANAQGAEEKTYTVLYNLNEENTEEMPEYQFLSGNMKGMTGYDSRLYVQIDLTLDGEETYQLVSDCYIMEGGKKAVVGDESGIGMTMITTAEGTYVDNGDGTVTISEPEHVHHDLATDTYSVQMKDASGIDILGNTEDGSYDSEELPDLVTLVPETIFTLDEEGAILSYEYLHPEEYETEEETEDGQEAEAGAELMVIPSDDAQTTFTLFDNGTYEFYFEAYDIKDAGTYAWDGGVLTVTDVNGKATESSANGDNVVFHYEYSESDQLAGDYTVEAAALADALN